MGWRAGGPALTLLLWPQNRFTGLMREKADLQERVEELEHRCIQLSGETDTIGEREASARAGAGAQLCDGAESLSVVRLPACPQESISPFTKVRGQCSRSATGRRKSTLTGWLKTRRK